MNSEQVAFYLQWWCFTWRWADPSWFAGWQATGLDEAGIEHLAPTRHAEWMALLGVPTEQPPEPSDAVLKWLSLSEEQRDEVLRLANRVCFPEQQAVAEVAPEQEQWCRSIAKGLRPGAWLKTNGPVDIRVLLASWLGDACWPRIRMSWPKEQVTELASGSAEWPARKLDALWQALVWRVLTP